MKGHDERLSDCIVLLPQIEVRRLGNVKTHDTLNSLLSWGCCLQTEDE